VPAILALLILIAAPALACTENRVLDLVGRLEAPGGHDTVYSGVRVQPSRPITTMTVGEVLNWQRQAVRAGSVSSAAGRYQIIRPTLQRLVDEGVVSRSERFDAGTQDRLGRHLLRETGYRNGDATPATANRIARVWAALPDLTTGRSAYEGVAGNHALITGPGWQGILDCSLTLNDVATEIATIRDGARFGFHWDRALEEMARTADVVMGRLADTGALLVLGLLVVDFVLRGGGWIFAGSLSGSMSGLAARLLVVTLCLGVLLFPDALLGSIRRLAFEIAGAAGAGSFSLADFAAGRIALAFSLMEGMQLLDWGSRVLVRIFGLLIVVAAALQIALMIYWILNLVLVGASGLLALGFGGLKETTRSAEAYVRHLIGAGLALLTALLVVTASAAYAWDLRAAADVPLATAPAILLIEIVAVALIWALPRSLSALASGS